jgi:diaminohydroxyphosphoribosylaminopyrimidine deaminase/5-amino-6-(5-phosphoribosylamino)uracil reductase
MSHEMYMNRALQLAQIGIGSVSPNPMVGCVIVKDHKIIGEGWYEKYGEPHAEVNAIASVVDQSMMEGADMYVTLEPCSHTGKTPPCADLICRFKFNKIYIATIDSNPLVAGKGIAKINAHGIPTQIGLLAIKARILNKRFFTFYEKNRPYITLKWAQTADGFVAREDYSSKWISNELSRTFVQRMRMEEDAIMVGTNTALYDNPKLTVRIADCKQPTRIVVDKNLRLPSNLSLFDGQSPTLVYNTLITKVDNNTDYISIENGANFIQKILLDLKNRKIQSIIIEGGSKLLQSFIEANLWDEAHIFESINQFKKGIKAPLLPCLPANTIVLEDNKRHLFYNLNPSAI